MPAGRPSKYTKALADKICARIAQGESLRKICEDKAMPNIASVINWRREKPEFFAHYTKAQEDRADHYADEIVEIADTAEDAAKARLQVDARKWVASKLKSKAYGEKVTQEHTGGVSIQVVTGVPRND